MVRDSTFREEPVSAVLILSVLPAYQLQLVRLARKDISLQAQNVSHVPLIVMFALQPQSALNAPAVSRSMKENALLWERVCLLLRKVVNSCLVNPGVLLVRPL